MKQTKIVATISDLRCDVDFIRSLYEAGINVVRLNSAHMNEEGFDRVIGNVRAVSPHLAVLMDTKGPEVRTTVCDEPIEFHAGDRILIKPDPEQKTTHDCICVSYPLFVQDVEVGSRILVDDGDLEIEVVAKSADALACVLLNDGTLGSRKSVNVPGVRINLPSLTEKDKQNILYSIRKGVDFIAHSFVRNKQDVLDIQHILDKEGSDIKIIAKIENQEGVDNIDEILDVAYGVMIARGDLGIEVPQEKIPAIQRMLIRKCVERKSPVIVATQMLHSMIKNPRPTRAEVTDVANAIYYRTDAVMLSGETAYGKYPLEAVRTMSRIIEEAEKNKIAANDIRVSYNADDVTTTAFLAKQAVKSIAKLGVKAIITDSFTGRTARYLAAFRGRVPVYAICYEEKIIRQLALSYGVITAYESATEEHQEGLRAALLHLIDGHCLMPEDMVAYMRGLRGKEGSTTALEIDLVKYLISRER
ncbi:pyruvate kinase [Porphyromonas gulae]|uniref:Pyruvate kinase n=1 Tax=Porphyromonas gulae TaxID=111105 RepID=A0A099WYI0_9PORP|nr:MULTISPECIES: pyruvate kinase [Porphyromonas]KGL49558.1 pyruvate kinase [Porphyromonas gulae]KGL54975.1 pyruvate kinase [Porphyromonas sp. COT-052 OH4946]KGN69011.1 pyruvate kinase [Porphyromonas gulae]KGN94282.1 pyruvate kinase [Porphyromonas gulae]KGO02779.1 pyruvate kinase [Porphyromonas gulae]